MSQLTLALEPRTVLAVGDDADSGGETFQVRHEWRWIRGPAKGPGIGDADFAEVRVGQQPFGRAHHRLPIDPGAGARVRVASNDDAATTRLPDSRHLNFCRRAVRHEQRACIECAGL